MPKKWRKIGFIFPSRSKTARGVVHREPFPCRYYSDVPDCEDCRAAAERRETRFDV